jgi:lysophospholipase L1-like esterase
LPLPKVDSYYRVLLSGGSAAECGLLSWKDSIGGHLETLLSVPDACASLGVEAAHVGVIAHSQLDAHGIVFILKNILPYYRSLDMVILLTGHSDVALWLEAGAPTGAAAPSVDKSDEWLLNYPEMRFRVNRPAIYLILKRVWIYYFGKTVIHANAGRHIAEEMEFRSRAMPHVNVDSDPSVMVRVYKQNLRSAVDIARRHAKRVILVRQYWFDESALAPQDRPLLWQGRLGSPKAPSPPKFIKRSQMIDLYRLVGQATQEVANECGVECVNLVNNLEPREGTFYDGTHFAPEGGRQTAEVIAKAILGRA